MWREYESEQGAAIETIPGFRKVKSAKADEHDIYPIAGFWHYKGRNKQYLVYHRYDKLYSLELDDLEADPKRLYEGANYNNSVASFAINNNLYFMSAAIKPDYDAHMIVVNEDESGNIQAKRIDKYYVPTTYYNGQPYEQRNGLGDSVLQVETDGGIEDSEDGSMRNVPLYEGVMYAEGGLQISKVLVDGEEYTKSETNAGNKKYYVLKSNTTFPSGTMIGYSEVVLQFSKQAIYKSESQSYKKIEIEYKVYPARFNVVENLTPFKNDKITMSEAILGCTKSAVYDGRVFLTGNPDLPNTVFYSQRNLTGANDPTYFGVYNYFNDGDGNTPNVDLLSTPSMLMVIKGDTTQDGSVYYHVGADNPHSEKSVRDLVPRVYPSTQGAAGLGSAGTTEAYSLSCNFLDDPVFLSKRGLECASKEQLNGERTLGHRSSNIDKLLIKEDLAHASIAEWKGYLVICCNGHIYLADSKAVSKHQDGSYQYEWFYLEGVGTYERYDDACYYASFNTTVYSEAGNELRLKDVKFDYNPADSAFTTIQEHGYKERQKLERVPLDAIVYCEPGFDNVVSLSPVKVYYIEEDGVKYPVVLFDNEKKGVGEFYGAKRVLAVGDLLFFATDYDICVFNTDKRGVPVNKDDDDIWESDKIDSSWYTFNGVPYKSACALRLDDCDRKSLTKTTIYGTTVARLKMMPGSRCKIKSSTNGRDWIDVAEAYSTRMDFSDLRFDNMAFTENEDNVTVIREVSRGWVQKQYYFESDGFCEPFGLYELSYIYKIAGKIRYY
jgi:hypothetical protein